MKTLAFFNTKKLPIIFLAVTLLLSLFVLYTPGASAKNDTTQFSAVRAQEHIEVISREPHSYYDRDAHEDVRQYLISTLSDYLGPFRVTEFNYTVDQVKTELEASYPSFDPDEVLYPVENVLGVLPGENPEGIMLVSHYDSRGHVGRTGEQGRSYGAMDDGYGVGTMLELAYLLKDSNPKNSIYFLFTDAEEVGLYGAIMAAAEQTLMDNVKFIINLESRGSHGPAYMFETSANNAKVIDLYRKANYPVTYSMATAVYELMPNFTDFTPLMETGKPGLNFAVLAGLDNYHTPFDRYEFINISSIQHMGSQIEPVIREFISDSKYIEDNYFTADSNQVFFTIFAGIMINYSQVFAIILAFLLLVLFGFVTFLKVKNQTLTKTTFTKTLFKGLLLFLLMVVVGLIYGYVVAFLGKVPFSVTYTRVSLTEIPTALLMIGLAVIMIKKFKSSNDDALYIGVMFNVLLTLVTTFTLEGASFLFAFTALFGLVAIFTNYIPNKLARQLVYGISYAFILFMLIPILYSFYNALTVGGTVVLTVLLTINGSVALPIINKQFVEE
ncbi:M28 family peptidase [Acholeplasma equirhinis]|uniref:M28 family peptidase n=1 Tax=Acholeplasma equirhinis TaxID=555393 RepID=UPI00197A8A07|nr:M28 family peptidase [Acholeplasma equirhinis]MBN3489936.1 M28 family peptidase [Acholeplasma equirhinis]